jgi:hypothetical protein
MFLSIPYQIHESNENEQVIIRNSEVVLKQTVHNRATIQYSVYTIRNMAPIN